MSARPFGYESPLQNPETDRTEPSVVRVGIGVTPVHQGPGTQPVLLPTRPGLVAYDHQKKPAGDQPPMDPSD